MGYELCVFEPSYAADREAALAAWDQSAYWDTSLPDHDRAAAKWRVKDALLAFDSKLLWIEPSAPKKPGFLAKLLGNAAPPQRCLKVYVETNDEGITFDVFDQAVEINLPWDTKEMDTRTVVRDLWRYLEHFSRTGWSTLYDTERDAVLNLETDFEAVLAGYIKNLEFDDAADASADARASAKAARGKPFTGNLVDK